MPDDLLIDTAAPPCAGGIHNWTTLGDGVRCVCGSEVLTVASHNGAYGLEWVASDGSGRGDFIGLEWFPPAPQVSIDA